MGLSGDCSHSREDLPEAREFIWKHFQQNSRAEAVISTTHWDGRQLLPAELHLAVVPSEAGEPQLSYELRQNGAVVEKQVFTRIRKANGGRIVCNAESFDTPYRLVFEPDLEEGGHGL